MESDADLVKRVLAGETPCFRTLVERYQDAVYGVALSKTRSFADAEDVAQDAFMSAFESLASLKDPARFGSWLYGIALNKLGSFLRRTQVRQRAPISPRPPESPADDEAARQETRAGVMAALGKLSDAHRETATLFYINGYSQDDISRFTSRPLGTVKRRLHDARKQLRKELVAMVETELKQSRPGQEFTDRVLRRVTQVRVWVSGEEQNTLLLTDSDKRSFPIIIGPVEGRAIEPWLSGRGSAEATDLHTVLVRVLGTFGWGIEEVCVAELRDATFIGSLKIRSGRQTYDLDCRPSDGLNLAARTSAPVFVLKEIVDHCVIKRPDGKPMSPAAAWRATRQRTLPPSEKYTSYRGLPGVLKAIEADPEACAPRSALFHIMQSSFKLKSPTLKDAKGPVLKLRRWVKAQKGTPLEGVAEGLMGAVHFAFSRLLAGEAIPHLERARQLRPDDKAIAFDLAAAYAMAGRHDEALDLLREEDIKTAASFGNFAALWPDPRFREIAGKPVEDRRHTFQYAQLHILFRTATNVPSRRRSRPKSVPPAETPPDEAAKTVRKLGKSRTRELEKLLAAGPLVRVESVWRANPKGKGREWMLLDVEGQWAARLRLRISQRLTIDVAVRSRKWPRPPTPDLCCHALTTAGIKPEAVVLLKRTRAGLEAALVVRTGERREVIAVEGTSALCLAMTANCPIAIAESLAERLYVRGSRGRPVSLRTARTRIVG